MPAAKEKDPAIKLFGKTINLHPDDAVSGSAAVNTLDQRDSSSSSVTSSRDDKKHSEEASANAEEDVSTDPATSSSGFREEPKESNDDKENRQDQKEDGHETQDPDVKNTTSQEKTSPRKPDKAIPCPRCNSMDTKFCYYNNYNVKQPRHFCKNCQRYWTAGGTMRNVPVGSGRRKNKASSASYYRHIIVPDQALQVARGDFSRGIHHHHCTSLKSNVSVLAFGTDALLCESMASSLNLADKTSQDFVRNGFSSADQRVAVPCTGRDNGEDNSSGSSGTTSNSTEKGGLAGVQTSDLQAHHQKVSSQGFWNSGQWTPAAIAPHSYISPGFPISFYPVPSYWGCSAPAPWNMQWVTTSSTPPDHDRAAPTTGPNSPTLGKHSRDGNTLNSRNEELLLLRESNLGFEQRAVCPKTLRKSDGDNQWANGGNIFKAFRGKTDDRRHDVETSLALRANPAALCRSLGFHEST